MITIYPHVPTGKIKVLLRNADCYNLSCHYKPTMLITGTLQKNSLKPLNGIDDVTTKQIFKACMVNKRE